MHECPKCKSTEIRKDGIVKKKQRYKCKTCNYRFTVAQIGKPLSKKRDAFILYLSGLDYRKIGNIINTSHVAVFNWLKDINKNSKQIKGNKLKILKFESMLEYLEQKDNKENTKGLLLIEFTDETTNIMFTMRDKL